MDLKKTGQFIAERRKAKDLTQAKLAEILLISEKTVSKWETGKGFPDTSLILPLCEALDISANELLSAKVLDEKEYKEHAEDNLVLLANTEQKHAKFLLQIMWTMGIFATILFLGITMLVAFAPLKDWIRIVILSVSLLLFITVCLFLLLIEQRAGFYECKRCGHKFVPTYKAVLLAMHSGTTRYLKCPHCQKRSWCKKTTDGNTETDQK